MTTFVKSKQIGKLLEPHIRSLLEQDLENDYIYGLPFDEINWKMASKVVKFQENDIIVGDIVFKGTPGLLELIYSKSINIIRLTIK